MAASSDAVTYKVGNLSVSRRTVSEMRGVEPTCHHWFLLEDQTSACFVVYSIGNGLTFGVDRWVSFSPIRRDDLESIRTEFRGGADIRVECGCHHQLFFAGRELGVDIREENSGPLSEALNFLHDFPHRGDISRIMKRRLVHLHEECEDRIPLKTFRFVSSESDNSNKKIETLTRVTSVLAGAVCVLGLVVAKLAFFP